MKVLCVNTYLNNHFWQVSLKEFSTSKFHRCFHHAFHGISMDMAFTQNAFCYMQIAIFIPCTHEGTAPALLSLWGREVTDAVKPGQLSCARRAKPTLP